MADKIKMVNVKLAARCLVNDQIREAGETVDLPETTELGEPYAVSFGEIVKPAKAPAESKPTE
jgi:hypothetical protein